MEPDVLLVAAREPVLDEAYSALQRSQVSHYRLAGEALTRRRLAELFDLVVDAIRTRHLAALNAHVEQVAEDRFNQGYDVSEVQTAFNALEEATWSRIFAEMEPAQFAEALGLVSTILGAAKDALARNYVSLATNAHAPSLNLQALFAGTEGRGPS